MKSTLLFLALLCGAVAAEKPTSIVPDLHQALRGAAEIGYIVGKCDGTEAELEQLMKEVQDGNPAAVTKFVQDHAGKSQPVAAPVTTMWGDDYLKAYPAKVGIAAVTHFHFVFLSGPNGTPSYEFGLRSDGVVVWREVK